MDPRLQLERTRLARPSFLLQKTPKGEREREEIPAKGGPKRP